MLTVCAVITGVCSGATRRGLRTGPARVIVVVIRLWSPVECWAWIETIWMVIAMVTDDRPLMIGVSARALFDMTVENRVLETSGLDAYREYQRVNRDVPLKPGVAYHFIRRMLSLNTLDDDESKPPLVEVAILSHMDPDTACRVMKSLKPLELDIAVSAFTSGASLTPYIKSYGVRLYLSTSESSVREAVDAGLPAGHIIRADEGMTEHDTDDGEIRIAFDFDGIIASDDSERVFQTGGLEQFNANETRDADKPMEPGPLEPFLRSLSAIQNAERDYMKTHKDYRQRLKTAIVTARDSQAGIRVMNTLDSWGIRVDEAFYMAGHNKNMMLDGYRPHLFLDDSPKHIQRASHTTTSVHVPFGIANQKH